MSEIMSTAKHFPDSRESSRKKKRERHLKRKNQDSFRTLTLAWELKEKRGNLFP